MASSAAASLSGGEIFTSLVDRRHAGAKNVRAIPAIRCSLIPSRGRGRRSFKAMAISAAAPVSRRECRGEAVASEKLDEWMRDSVGDIVRNLGEAPLMVQVRGGDAVVEKAVDWREVKGRWEAGESPLPEGLIFVEELSDRQDEEEKEENDMGEEGNDGDIDGVTRAFGVVVQGKGLESSPVCYLLKTCTAGFGSRSGCGFGLGCTHFCLVRVSGFRETTASQLKNCWLLQAQAQGP